MEGYEAGALKMYGEGRDKARRGNASHDGKDDEGKSAPKRGADFSNRFPLVGLSFRGSPDSGLLRLPCRLVGPSFKGFSRESGTSVPAALFPLSLPGTEHGRRKSCTPSAGAGGGRLLYGLSRGRMRHGTGRGERTGI